MSDLATLNKSVQLSSASNDFSVLAQSLLASRGKIPEAMKQAPDASPRLRNIFKSAVAVANTTTQGWANELAGYKELSAGFIGSLAAHCAFDRIIADGGFTRIPVKTRFAIASSAAKASAVSELAAKPISNLSVTSHQLEEIKVAGTVIVTDELVKMASSGVVGMIGAELRRACAVAVDAAFLEAISSGTGVASNGTTGMSAAQFLADVTKALEAISVGADSRLYLILPPATWKIASLLRDTGGMLITAGLLGNIRVVPSDAATDTGTAVLIDAKGIAADAGSVELDATIEAAIQAEGDNPTAGATTLISLFQNNLTGIRVERRFSAELMRSDSAACITGYETTA